MRVVFLSQYFDRVPPPEQNSVGIVTYEIARRLAADAQVTVLAAHGSRRTRCRNFSGMMVEELAGAPPRAWNAAAKVWSRVRPRTDPIFAQPFYAFDYLVQALRRIRQLQPDVVHVQNFPQHVPYVRRASPRSAIVLHMHCEWLNQLDERMIASAIEASDLVLGCSEHVIELARAKFNTGRFAVLPNGVPVEAIRTASRPRQSKALFVGRISPEKGLHTLLAAWPTVVASCPDARLELIGAEASLPRSLLIDISEEREVLELGRFYRPGASYGETLRAMIPGNIVHTVSFRGAVSYEAVKLAMAEAAVLLNPSLSELFGMSFIEALAEETPFIATSVGGMKEIAQATGGGELVRPDAPNDLAAAIIRRLKNPEEGAEIGRRARERAIELYAWPRIAALTRSYHLEAITAHQRRMARVDAAAS